LHRIKRDRFFIDIGIERAAQAAVGGNHHHQGIFYLSGFAKLDVVASPSRFDRIFDNIRLSRSVYGRICTMAFCAFRSLAADTIFMAFVICCVD
jgi:hypothetical protein